MLIAWPNHTLGWSHNTLPQQRLRSYSCQSNPQGRSPAAPSFNPYNAPSIHLPSCHFFVCFCFIISNFSYFLLQVQQGTLPCPTPRSRSTTCPCLQTIDRQHSSLGCIIVLCGISESMVYCLPTGASKSGAIISDQNLHIGGNVDFSAVFFRISKNNCM